MTIIHVKSPFHVNHAEHSADLICELVDREREHLAKIEDQKEEITRLKVALKIATDMGWSIPDIEEVLATSEANKVPPKGLDGKDYFDEE